MIIKKLAVPFINDKLLMQSEHCYIATGGISEEGFDFVRSRIPTKTKMDIVTGLDVLTSPQVLKRIWRNYQDRITLNVYTRNVFHANVYIFDLPYRKTVAFVGSGNFTLGGIKDHEEIFYKVTDAKEIEALKSWFTGYFEFSEPLTEALIEEYERVYPSLKQREIQSRQEKEEFIALTTGGFSWDAIKFKNQYFKKEDYLTLGSNKAQFDSPEIRAERVSLQNKLLQLHESIKQHVHDLKLYECGDSNAIVSSLDPKHHLDHKLKSMWIAYGRSEKELSNIHAEATRDDFINLQIIIRQKEFGIWLVPGKARCGKHDREYVKSQMNEPEYRSQFLKLLTGLGAGYWIEIAGDKRTLDMFQNEEALWEFTKADDWMYYSFVIGKTYQPGDTEISSENISSTITKEFDKLILFYRHLKSPSAEKKK